jgi:hypothetical protein
VARLSQYGEFGSQLFDLKSIQNPGPHDKTMLSEAGELFVAESPWSAIRGQWRKQTAEWCMSKGQIAGGSGVHV